MHREAQAKCNAGVFFFGLVAVRALSGWVPGLVSLRFGCKVPARSSHCALNISALAGAGCPSFGGQRTAAAARSRGWLRLVRLAGTVHTEAMKTNSKRRSSFLAHKPVSVPSHVSALCPMARSRLATSRRIVYCTGTPNHSIERTHNGGARWRAPSRSAAPLRAAHVER